MIEKAALRNRALVDVHNVYGQNFTVFFKIYPLSALKLAQMMANESALPDAVVEPSCSLNVTKCGGSGNPVAVTYHDRIFSTRRNCATTADGRRAVEREFSEEMRDARFPAGWFVLPIFAAAIVIGAAVVFLF